MATNPTYWRLIAHHEDREGAVEEILFKERIGIGWGAIGDLRLNPPSDARDIRDRIRLAYPESSNATQGGQSLLRLWQMKPGDRVFVAGPRPQVLLFEITGEYEWFEEGEPSGTISTAGRFGCLRVTRQRPGAVWGSNGYRAKWCEPRSCGFSRRQHCAMRSLDMEPSVAGVRSRIDKISALT
jgi:hypothetical protein